LQRLNPTSSKDAHKKYGNFDPSVRAKLQKISDFMKKHGYSVE